MGQAGAQVAFDRPLVISSSRASSLNSTGDALSMPISNDRSGRSSLCSYITSFYPFIKKEVNCIVVRLYTSVMKVIWLAK